MNEKCKTWEIQEPTEEGHWKHSLWHYQITAPAPLAAINWLFKQAKAVLPKNPLVGGSRTQKDNMVWVNKDFFASNPQGNQERAVSEDTLAFFSLVLSYVKPNGKNPSTRDNSAKTLSPIMPRTDFLTMYQSVKDKIKGDDLYELVKQLTCYTNEEEYTELVHHEQAL